MVAIDQAQGPSASGRIAGPWLQAWIFIGLLAALLTVSVCVARGFGENGLRLGSEFAWRFTFAIYFLAIVAGPVARLIPVPTLRRLCEERRQLIWGFCASFGVYLLSVALPNLVMPVGPDNEGFTASLILFVLFGIAISGIIAFAARRDAAQILGQSVRVTLLGVGMATFWLTYALGGLARITGPHRPEIFSGLSLSLMILALLLRFADGLTAKFRAPHKLA
ncbi:MAG TPA: hypothetical protein VGM68_02220 [Rhizomicrobium sp.]